ncbi:hypothetical protein AJ80_04325 [Polytolypa hystricis UAMH7299]|uniref:GPI anchored protein n=1 Tax=Polytolypa hystricis (strain UAMH7299) TaxID=1447883 RepID=A0A2B7YBJ0_POLH7|nr:hypothetical protein AJ80_04325 [Polytolypa hystricis UAMH7299]
MSFKSTIFLAFMVFSFLASALDVRGINSTGYGINRRNSTNGNSTEAWVGARHRRGIDGITFGTAANLARREVTVIVTHTVMATGCGEGTTSGSSAPSIGVTDGPVTIPTINPSEEPTPSNTPSESAGSSEEPASTSDEVIGVPTVVYSSSTVYVVSSSSSDPAEPIATSSHDPTTGETTVVPQTSSIAAPPAGHAVHNAGIGGAMLAGAVGFAALVAM